MMEFLNRLIKNEEAQGMTEYALILGVIPFGVVLLFPIIEDKLIDLYTKVINVISQK